MRKVMNERLRKDEKMKEGQTTWIGGGREGEKRGTGGKQEGRKREIRRKRGENGRSEGKMKWEI